MNLSAFLAILAVLAAPPALAEPLSAIDWLSESLETPEEVAPTTPIIGLLIDEIETSILANVQKDNVGILPPQISGIPTDFWGDSSATRLATFIRSAPMDQIPEITALWRRIVLAEIDPPTGMTEDNILLLARLDNLMTIGDLDPAEALLKAADPNNPQLFRRWFDISILTQRAGDACQRMVSTPNFAPTLQARIFCLARSGDWSAAAITLATGHALGIISDDNALLLGMFLDPELYEGEAIPPIPAVLTPLTFVMREALALPRPPQSLPLAFLHMDIQNKAGWKVRIESAERLVRERAIPSVALLDLYLEGSPSASGGVWDRVAAVQNLNVAIENNDSAKLPETLIKAYHSLTPLGLNAALADWFAIPLGKHTFTEKAKSIVFELAVLNPNAIDIALRHTSSDQLDRFVLSILSENYDVPPNNNLQLAIFNALSGLSPKTVLHQAVDEGRQGEAILSALTLMHDGPAADVGDIETALSVMAYEGFKDEAKRIATQLLLLGEST